MRQQLNCPNCGAPITSEQCQYCGTLFYDFSAIEIGKPCFLKIKYGNAIMLVKAITDNVNVNISTDTYEVCDSLGCCVTTLVRNQNMDLSMEFNCVPFNDHLIEIRSVTI